MLAKNSGKIVIRSNRIVSRCQPLALSVLAAASPHLILSCDRARASPSALATGDAVAIIRRAGVLLVFWHTHTAVQTEAEPGGHI
jgi:hypothetical protein